MYHGYKSETDRFCSISKVISHAFTYKNEFVNVSETLEVVEKETDIIFLNVW